MSPDKIREMLTAACPELTWVVDGGKVHAEGTALWARVDVYTPTSWGLWLGRAAFKADRVMEDPGSVRRGVWGKLSKGEVRSVPGPRLLDARIRLELARHQVETQGKRLDAARREVVQCEGSLQEACDALAKAEAHAAKVGA